MSWLTTDAVLERDKGVSAYNQAEGLMDIPGFSASIPINQQITETYVTKLPQYVQDMLKFGTELLNVSNPLPVHPLGQQLWSEHARAIDNAIYHKMTSQEALQEAYDKLQPEIDKFWASYTGT